MKEKHDSSQSLNARRSVFFIFAFFSCVFFTCLGYLNLMLFGLYQGGFAPIFITLGVFSISIMALFLMWRSLQRAYRQLWPDRLYQRAEKAKRIDKPTIEYDEAEFVSDLESQQTETKKNIRKAIQGNNREKEEKLQTASRIANGRFYCAYSWKPGAFRICGLGHIFECSFFLFLSAS
jgi:hypothetical protein